MCYHQKDYTTERLFSSVFYLNIKLEAHDIIIF